MIFLGFVFWAQALEVNEDVELTQALYGRSSANFLAETKNVQVTLPPKTRGKIISITNFKTGNKGLFIEIQEGPFKGEKFWVYYNSNKPAITILEGDKTVSGPKAGLTAETQKNTKAYRPATEVALKSIEKAQGAVSELGRCDICRLMESTTAGHMNDYNSKYPDSTGLGCMGIKESGSVEFCRSSEGISKEQILNGSFQSRAIEQFQIHASEGSRSQDRVWKVHFRSQARQDLGISIEDSSYGAEIMLFPRARIPHVEVEGPDLKVTLPTGELVRFDQNTGRIKSGVLSDNPPTGKAPPQISYSGSGVMLQVKGHDVPSATFLQSAPEVLITKKGHSPCTASTSELWPDRKQNGKPNHFRFARDEDFNTWLKTKCPFNLDSP